MESPEHNHRLDQHVWQNCITTFPAPDAEQLPVLSSGFHGFKRGLEKGQPRLLFSSRRHSACLALVRAAAG